MTMVKYLKGDFGPEHFSAEFGFTNSAYDARTAHNRRSRQRDGLADNDAADLQDLESQRQPEMLVTPEMAAAVPGVTRASQFATFRVRSGRVPRPEGEEAAFVYPNGQMPTAPPRDFVRLPKLYYEEPEQ